MNPSLTANGLHAGVWPAHVPRRLPRHEATLWHNLETSALRDPDKDALIFFGRRFSFGDILQQAERIAGWLQTTAGVKPGDRVLLSMQNSPQFIIAFMAVLRAGAVVVPANPMSRAAEFAYTLADPQARVAICSSDLVGEMVAAQALVEPDQTLRHLLVARYTDCMPDPCEAAESPPDAWWDWLAAEPALPEWATRWTEALGADRVPRAYEGRADELAAICYTSGTTGKPKGCMHTHRSLGHNVRASPLWTGGSASDVALGVVPVFHITGMQYCMNIPLYLGSTVVLMPRWDRELAGRLISRYGVTTWTNIPTMVIDLLGSPHFGRFDLSSLRYIGGGGAAMPEAVALRLFDSYGLRYIEGYGLTETAAPSHSNPPDAPKRQCLGIPHIGVDARIIDPETLRELPQGETGEIVIDGPQLFVGYWQRPQDSAQAFIEIGGRRFFRTGDLGWIDESGYFFIADRLKRMINASGFKVWPAEVENLLFSHPAVQEACVIASTDDYRGETVKAVIVLRPEWRGRVSASDIEAWSRERMAAFKVPRRVAFVDALPKSASGKVMWRVLQEQEAAGPRQTKR